LTPSAAYVSVCLSACLQKKLKIEQYTGPSVEKKRQSLSEVRKELKKNSVISSNCEEKLHEPHSVVLTRILPSQAMQLS